MNLFKISLFTFLFTATICNGQNALLECTQAKHVIAGLAKTVQQDQKDAFNRSKGYFIVELKGNKKNTLDILSLKVLDKEGQMELKPLTLDYTEKKDANNYFVTLRFQKDNSIRPTKKSIKSEGLISYKVNGKLNTLAIQKFEVTKTE